MQAVTTDGGSVIAPEVPELIKKQDHTPVQSKERGAGREGGGGMQNLDGDFSPERHRDLMVCCRCRTEQDKPVLCAFGQTEKNLCYISQEN